MVQLLNLKIFCQKRRFLCMLPIIMLPFLTLFFWSLGGGQPAPGLGGPGVFGEKGLNLKLPAASDRKLTDWNKLLVYQQADLDSEKMLEAKKQDPNWRKYFLMQNSPQTLQDTQTLMNTDFGAYSKDMNNVDNDLGGEGIPATSPQILASGMEQKIRQLEGVLRQPVSPGGSKLTDTGTFRDAPGDLNSGQDLDRLTSMLNLIRNDSNPDPEMQQINTVLDKILAIQQRRGQLDSPGVQKIPGPFDPVRTDNSPAGPVRSDYGETTIRDSGKTPRPKFSRPDSLVITGSQEGFYPADSSVNKDSQTGQLIAAAVPQTQTIASGSPLKLELDQDMNVAGTLIPRGTYLYAETTMQDNRLQLTIRSIRYRQILRVVSLKGYDLDGLPGIRIPPAVNREAGIQLSGETLNNSWSGPLDPTLAAKTATAGITALKNWIRKKLSRDKVTIRAGYRILLKANDASFPNNL